MKTITSRMHRFTRLALATFGLMMVWNATSLAEGWGDNRPPIKPPSAVNSTEILYGDGCELYSNGIYINSVGTFQLSPAYYDLSGNLNYPDGTVLYPDGSWTAGS